MGVLAAIASAIVGLIREDAQLAQILNGRPRVYHVWAPENAALPYITYAVNDTPDLEADGLSSGELLLDVWDHAPTPERAEAAGHRITQLLDGKDIATAEGTAEAVQIAQTAKGFMDTDAASVHRWTSRWTLRYVRQGERFGGE